MLKKKFRLQKDYAFSATYRVRHSYCIGGIVLWVGKKKVKPEIPTKVGFVVSKKTHKRSVRRNRLKRLMRESYRLLQKENQLFDSQNYLSLIFVGFEKALAHDFKNVNDIVSKLLKKIQS